jgi:hypothetical protein
MAILNALTKDFGLKDLSPQMAALDCTDETLKNMWLVRWGGEWVNQDSLMGDPFWFMAFTKLDNHKMLERHHLFERDQTVYRLK